MFATGGVVALLLLSSGMMGVAEGHFTPFVRLCAQTVTRGSFPEPTGVVASSTYSRISMTRFAGSQRVRREPDPKGMRRGTGP